MSDVIQAMSPIPILKMEGGGVMPLNQPSVIQPMSLTQPPLISCSSIITSHPVAAPGHQLHIIEPPSPLHTVPSMVNDDIAEADNIAHKDPLASQNQVSFDTRGSFMY